MNLRPLAAALCLLAPLVAAEGGRRAVTHEDVWLMRRVGAPVPSPDGQRVVFPVTIPAYEAKAQTSDLWLAPVDGSVEPRQITHDKAAESGVAWSPDSTRIAFSAQRQGDEATQIYVIDLAAGGEARRITEVVTGARQPRWSPDGTKLLFVSEVHPGAADEEANRKAAQAVKDRKHTARVYDSFPVKYWDRWLDDRRGHLLVQEAKPGAKARDLLAGTKLVAEPGFGGRQGDAGEYLPAAWTPDGGAVVFVATEEPTPACRRSCSRWTSRAGNRGP
jgi:dipeptidyl aminopeptidase/acylaminoacyl peptidase